MLDVTPYLHRICYSGSTDPTRATLRALHRAHMLAVPFENLNIAIGRTIVLDEHLLIHKIVQERRGGFCYELNGAFAALLRALGFSVTLLSARVARAQGDQGPEFDHLALRVDLEEPWLADVGFGDSFLEPLRLAPGIEQSDPAGNFRLSSIGEGLRMEKADASGEWLPQYSFLLHPRRLEEFEGMCRYHQTSPDSSFTQKSICSLAMPNGRITVSDMKLIITENGRREERALRSREERSATLKEKFGIAEPSLFRSTHPKG